MTVLTMPDGQAVDFGDMPPDQIKALIQKKFPDIGKAAPAKMGVGEDIARSAATGLGEGATQSVGLLGDVQSGADSLGTWVGDMLGLKPLTPEQQAGFDNPGKALGLPNINAPTTADVEQGIGFDKIKHQPQTTAGEYARTGASFAGPAAVAGIGRGIVKTGVKYGLVPGLTSEAAGQATEGTGLEPVARVLGGLGGAGVMAFMSRPSTAAGVLKRAMPGGVTNNDIMKADSLVAQSRQSGVPITWPEALHKVTEGRVDITGLQRILEQAPGGQPIMADFMSQRPGQTAKAMTGAMDDLTYGGQMTDPRQAGLGIQRTANDSLNDIRKRINAVAEPYYNAAAGTRIQFQPTLQSTPMNAAYQALRGLQGDPLYQAALKAVRDDPIHSRFVKGLPDDSVGVQNEIKKYFDRMGDKAAPLGDKAAAGVYGGLGRDVRDAAKTASPDYERALGLETDLRQRFLNPAEAGPLGALSRTDDILAQGRAVLASNAAEGSERGVRETIGLLSRRNPDQAFQLVRTHLQSQFDEAAQALIGGGNQWGGAKFAATIRGNSQQAKNLEAAVKALPDGDIRWDGLNAFLEVLEATGRRQRPGSLTAFNQQALEEMKRGGLPVEAARSVRTVGARLFDFYEQWKLGKNSAELARMITDPNAAKMLRDLANAKSAAGRETIAGYLVTYYATTGATKPLPAVPEHMQNQGGR
jgi:hypothetical protein